MKNNSISRKETVFHGLAVPEKGTIVGYGALIDKYKLNVPLPSTLSLISEKNRRYDIEGWRVFTSRYLPEDSLYKQLVFALKYEGLNLLVLKKLFECIGQEEFSMLVQKEPSGQYSRRLWFAYEWLMGINLSIPDLSMGNYIPFVDEKLQYAIEGGEKSSRHRVINNLPGTRGFCPLVRRTKKLDEYINAKLHEKQKEFFSRVHTDILQRAAAFLLLKDSKASFSIEGESPKSQRAARWGDAIGQAGLHDLTKEELLRLQQVVIENTRFVEMGFRREGGFVGEHDRHTIEPIPVHISARWQDVEKLTDGLLATNGLLLKSNIDAVIAATVIAFGFVFIHPFQDGNGRVHRYLIHHILAKKGFSRQGVIFPISASMLNSINDYRRALESYSKPLLNFIQWKVTASHNVEVQNETIDYYRYFDATGLAEYLYHCVNDTIQNIIPAEVSYLIKYDQFKQLLEEKFEMPDRMISVLVRFLEQNNGELSKRALEKEFSSLNRREVKEIEKLFGKIFFQ